MTKTQVEFIIKNILNDEMDAITALPKCIYFVLDGDTIVFKRFEKYLFKFNSAKEIVELFPYKVVPYTEGHVLGPNEIEIIKDGQKFICKLAEDNEGKRIKDYVTFESIVSMKVDGNYDKNTNI